MSTFTFANVLSLGKEFLLGLSENSAQYFQRLNNKNPDVNIDFAKAREAMRQLGVDISERFLYRATSPQLGEAKVGYEDLAFIKNSKKLPSSYVDQEGFITADAVEKLLFTTATSPESAESIYIALGGAFGAYEDIEIQAKFYSPYKEPDPEDPEPVLREDGAVVEKDATPLEVVVAFGLSPEKAFDRLYAMFKNGENNFKDSLADDFISIKDILGRAGAAPKPRDDLVLIEVQPGLPIAQATHPLNAHYGSMQRKLDREIRDGSVSSIYSIYQETQRRLIDAQLGFREAAEFIVFLQNVANILKEELPAQYDEWLGQYKTANNL